MELILFFAVVYFITLLVGRELEKIRIPWVFAALMLGLGFAATGFFRGVTTSGTFEFLARLGMYFFLFTIGFEIDLHEIRQESSFIMKAALVIILLEGIAGTLFIHTFFGTPWHIAGVVALSYATVGEAVLLPILEEFGLVDTRLGQDIIGVGVVDDTFEVFTVIIATIFVGFSAGHSSVNIITALFSLVALFGLTYGIMRLGSGEEDFTFSKTGMEDPALFLFVLFAIFGFIRLGHYAHASAIGALMAGIAIKNFLPQKRLEAVEREVKAVTYGFFGPLFFLWVGLDVSITVPSQLPFNTGLAPVYVFVGLILMQIILVKTVKIGASYLMGHNHLGVRKSILMGISLSVKFSTSIVILKMLFEQGLIGDALYSVLISAKIGFKFTVPFLLSFLIARWGLDFSET